MSKRAKRGFSLLEMLVALAILVFIVMGIGVGMDAGVKIYKEAIFEADSGSLSGIINTNLGDILRYSSRVTVNKGDNLQDASGVFVSKQDVEFVFTSMEYGIHDAYFCMPEEQEGTNDGVLQITNLKKEKTLELVNSGAYPDLKIVDFEIHYFEPGKEINNTQIRGGYFEVSYKIVSDKYTDMSRNVSTVIRLMNP